MLRKYVFLNKQKEVVGIFKYHDDIPEQAALVAAFETGAIFKEVALNSPATLGWYFNGEEYVQYPVGQ